jgi:Short C-terminal domain/Phospholipase_D-nuclease N-terminal
VDSFLDFFWFMLWFFLWIIWIWLLIKVFADIFRSEMGGFAKAMWVLFVVILPYIGVLIYLISQGSGMAQRDVAQAAAMDKAQREYIQSVTGSSGGGVSDELDKLSSLKDRGVISAEEFAAQKQKLLA